MGLTIVILLWLVWPTPWESWSDVQFTKLGGSVTIPMRKSRFDGHVESKMGDEWVQGQVIID